MADQAVAMKLADTKAAGEVKALGMFYTMLQNEPNRAFYGFVQTNIGDPPTFLQ